MKWGRSLVLVGLSLCSCVTAGTGTSFITDQMSPSVTSTIDRQPTATTAPSRTPIPHRTAAPTRTPSPTPTLDPAFNDVRIAYTTDSTLRLWQAGTSQRLADIDDSISDISLSDDGQYIAFLKNDRQELWLIDVDEKKEWLAAEALKLAPSIEASEPVSPIICQYGWIPQTTKIFISTGFCQLFGPLLNDLFLLDAETNQITQLLPDALTGVAAPSPNGKFLAVASFTDLTLIRLADLTYQIVYNYESLVYPGDVAIFPELVWTPDSAVVLAGIYTNTCADSNHEQYQCERRVVQILSMPTTGIANYQRYDVKADLFSLELSPDGSKVAYWQSVNNQRTIYDLHIDRVETHTGQTIEGLHDEPYDGWRPDSSGFVFRSGTGSELMIADDQKVLTYESGLPRRAKLVGIADNFVIATLDNDILLCGNDGSCLEVVHSIDDYGFVILGSR